MATTHVQACRRQATEEVESISHFVFNIFLSFILTKKRNTEIRRTTEYLQGKDVQNILLRTNHAKSRSNWTKVKHAVHLRINLSHNRVDIKISVDNNLLKLKIYSNISCLYYVHQNNHIDFFTLFIDERSITKYDLCRRCIWSRGAN